MDLKSFKVELHRFLDDKQQNGIVDLLRQIENCPYLYDKVLFIAISNQINPLSLVLSGRELVESARLLIDRLEEPIDDKLTEYHRILNKIKQNRGIGTTEILMDKTVADLDDWELSRFFQQERVINELESARENMREKTLHERLVYLSLGDNGHLFKGTFLCLGKRNQITSLHSTIGEAHFTHYKGLDKGIILTMEEAKGGLIQQYERIMHLLKVHIPLARNREKNEEEYEIPFIPLRELVANAFVHRNYGEEVRNFIQIELYDDRLEIKNPGRMPEGVSMANIEGTILVNPTIMAIFHLYKYVEKRGSGIALSQKILREKGLEPARFENIDNQNLVKVSLYRKQTSSLPKLSPEKKEEILSLLNQYELGSVFAALDEIGIKDYTYSRFKKEFILGKMDVDFLNRLETYLRGLELEKKEEKKAATNVDIAHFKHLMARGEIKKVIEELLSFAQKEKNISLSNELMLLFTRYNRNERDNHSGVLEREIYSIENNRIGAALLAILGEME